jgi:integrase
MAKTKNYIKTKGPVTLRLKPCRNGIQSLFLDIYRKGERRKEYLKMYIVPERSPADRKANRIVLEAANAIRAERMREILIGEAKIKKEKQEIPLLEWMQSRVQYAERIAREAGRSEKSNARANICAREHLRGYVKQKYGGQSVTLAEVDKDFCAGFAEYLGKVKSRNGGVLSINSRSLYFSKLTAGLNAAVKAGHITSNPVEKLDKTEKPHLRHTERSYLTEKELQLLINTPCRYGQDVRAAFLFSCFCGLRWSDIVSLTWADIRSAGNSLQIEKRMVKTHEIIYLPLSKEAAFFLPERQNQVSSSKVFCLPSYQRANLILKRWLSDAGLTKPISFHSARHTFATLLLSQNQDLYTVSKLLGHKSIQVTQIYATVVDRKKQEAVDSLSGLFSFPKGI